MKIGIYIEVVKSTNPTGISRYVKGLVEALLALNTSHEFHLYYQNYPRLNTINWLENVENVKHHALWVPKDVIGEHPNIWWKYYLPLRLWIDNIDVFHGPNHFVPLKGNIPSVVTIHDIAYYFMTVHGDRMDEWLKELTNLHMHKATKILAISKSTANDCQLQGIPRSKIEVVYQGYENRPNKEVNPDLLVKFGLNSSTPYILFLGTIQPRKNPEFLITEFAKIAQKIPHKLVLAGAPGISSKLVDKRIKEFGLQNKVVLTGFISDDERHTLYSFADLFVYPSCYEGFGLVILEAMSYDLPVITADNSSMPEAGGDAAILIDINVPSSLSNAVLSVIEDYEYKSNIINKSKAQSKKFKWADSARRVMDIYEELYIQKSKK